MLTLAFAQSASCAQKFVGSNPIVGLLPIAVIFVIFYLLIIRPQKKTHEEHARMVSKLEKNDEVITTSGIYGTIVNIQSGTITLRIDDNVKIKIQKSSIARKK